MQAIVTKYVPATNYKPSRIKAKCERGSHTIPVNFATPEVSPHIAAADALCRKFAEEDAKRPNNPIPIESNSWMRPRVCGGLPGGNVAHVFVPTNQIREALENLLPLAVKWAQYASPTNFPNGDSTIHAAYAALGQ